MKVFGADGVTIQQFNESAGGQVVFHLHVHVIPRKDGVPMKPPASEKEKPEVLADHALKLAAALKRAEALRRPNRARARDNSTASPTSTPANTERRTSRNAAKPSDRGADAARTAGSVASAPGVNEISLAITPASIAVATARTQTMISESSSRPRTRRGRAAPDLVRQEADQDQHQVGPSSASALIATASRKRWTA